MKGFSDTAFIFLALLACLIATVLVAIFVPSEARDPEITRALTYGVVGLVGALGGASKRRDTGDNP